MVKKSDYTKEIGQSGTSINYGIIDGEEYNWDLRGERAIKVYEEMRRGDATVNQSLSAIKEPILQAQYRVDPASEDKADVEVAEFVYDCLHHIVDWRKFLGEALTFLDFGHAVFEMVFEPRTVNGHQRLALVKLGFRKQTTIKGWTMEDGKPGIKQMTPSGKTFNIPAGKLVRITNKQEGDNFEGVSVLRTAYKHWYIADKLYKIDAIGHERQALGVLDILVPKGAKESDKKKMIAAARNLRANEESYIMRPEGWEVSFMDMKAKSLKDITPSLEHHTRKINSNILAQFLDFGTTGAAGSRATSEDHSRLFELSVQRVAEHIAFELQRTAVRTLVDLNYTNRPYPTLAVNKISDDDVTIISDAFKKFVEAGVLHPRPDDENTIRKMIGVGEVAVKDLKPFYSDGPTDDESSKVTAAVKKARQLRASIESELYEDYDRAA